MPNRAKQTQLLSKSLLLQCALCLTDISWAGADDAKINKDTESVTSAKPATTPNLGQTKFNPEMLFGGREKIDVTRFEHANITAPGKYRVDVYINEQWFARRDIDVNPVPNSIQTEPCITHSLLKQIGVDFLALPDAKNFLDEGGSTQESCFNVEKFIPDSSIEFDSSDLRLDVGIPQAYLTHMLRGYVDPQDWDRGINAGFLNYNVNTIRTYAPIESTQLFVGTNWGVNVGGWRLRYNGTYTNNSQSNTTSTTTENIINNMTNAVKQTGHWQVASAYAQRNIVDLKSQLTVGDAYTNGDLFNSVTFQGVQLASDDRMLPESQRGYAPVIRGVAETSAKVTVRQGGNIIYETTVPPGEFKIVDMYNSSFAGDFAVTITETDGRQKHYIVPYSAGVMSLRAGALRYSVSMGKLLNVSTQSAPFFTQGTWQYGVGQGVTLYSGAILGEYYKAGIVGAALSTSYGAFGLDVTKSITATLADDGTLSGQSWRLSYSKLIPETHTNFNMATYDYTTDRFMTLSDAARLRSDQPPNLLSPKQSFQVLISQQLGEKWGNIFVSGTGQYYWNNAPSSINYQAGYMNNLSWGNIGILLSRTLDAFGTYRNMTSINLTMPLGRATNLHRPTLTSSVTYDGQQKTALASVNGVLGANQRINYNTYANYGGGANSVGVGAQYTSPYGQAWASYSAGSTKQASLNASGALLVHHDGVLLSPSLGETMGIVYAPGAEGTSVIQANNKINSSGYCAVPFLNPYVNNDVVIDPKGGNMNMQLDTTSKQVAPQSGAIVLLPFSTTIGRAILLTITRTDDQPLPIGTSVQNENGTELGLLSQGGRFFSRGLAKEGKLIMKWGSGTDQQCTVNYSLPPEDATQSAQPYQQLALSCTIQ